MKALLAAVVLAALAASSAYAHRSNSVARPSSDLIYAPDGSIIGRDSDASVRLQMRRDYGSWEF